MFDVGIVVACGLLFVVVYLVCVLCGVCCLCLLFIVVCRLLFVACCVFVV